MQYFGLLVTDKAPAINHLFAALFDLIICSSTKMNLLIPSAAQGRTLDAIFPDKVHSHDSESDTVTTVNQSVMSTRNGLLAPRTQPSSDINCCQEGPKCGLNILRNFVRYGKCCEVCDLIETYGKHVNYVSYVLIKQDILCEI